ncbi:hypothetical protein MP638_000689 [Amoeboaphelidium occidentale]|nr:hypothetical protein MP638_000689 [Amoeboaphelidium occidentale]
MTSEVMKNKDFYSQPSIRTSLGGDTLDEVVLSLSQNGKHMDPKHSLIYCNMTQKCVAVHSFTRPMLYKGVQAQDHTNLTGFWVPTRHGLLQDIKKENIVHICWHGHEGSNHFSGLQNVGHVPYSLFPKTSLFQCLSGAAQDSFHNSSYRDQRENANFYAGMEISLLDIPPDTIDKN